jgi:flagellar biosynthesis/type III secretory pathway chaperone
VLQRNPYHAPSQPAPAGAAAAAVSERGRPAAGGAIEIVIQRLEEVVDQETAALKSRQKVDLKDFNDRKSHALLDLSRALRQMQAGGASQFHLKNRLAELRAKLEVNRRVLQMHLEAVREVSTTLADAIREQDSDGTYSPSVRMAYKTS